MIYEQIKIQSLKKRIDQEFEDISNSNAKSERSFTLNDGNKLQFLSGTDQSVSRLSDNYHSPIIQRNLSYNSGKSKLDLTNNLLQRMRRISRITRSIFLFT